MSARVEQTNGQTDSRADKQTASDTNKPTWLRSAVLGCLWNLFVVLLASWRETKHNRTTIPMIVTIWRWKNCTTDSFCCCCCCCLKTQSRRRKTTLIELGRINLLLSFLSSPIVFQSFAFSSHSQHERRKEKKRNENI